MVTKKRKTQSKKSLVATHHPVTVRIIKMGDGWKVTVDKWAPTISRAAGDTVTVHCPDKKIRLEFHRKYFKKDRPFERGSKKDNKKKHELGKVRGRAKKGNWDYHIKSDLGGGLKLELDPRFYIA